MLIMRGVCVGITNAITDECSILRVILLSRDEHLRLLADVAAQRVDRQPCDPIASINQRCSATVVSQQQRQQQ